MAGVHFVVDMQGLPALRARLQPGRLLQPTTDFIHDLGLVAHKTAMRAAKPHPADKGTLGRAIFLQFEQGGKVARVGPEHQLAGIMFTIEEGRKPGRRPPYSPIKRWAQSHGFIGTQRGAGKEVQALREKIKAEGTKGVYFMRTAQEVTQKALHDGIPKTAREIHDVWERGT